MKKTWLAWTALLLLACVARLSVVAVLFGGGRQVHAYEHGEIAANLLEGRGFTVRFLGVEGPTSQQAPLYPFLLAGIYRVCGVGTPASQLTMQLLQCLAGTALVAGVVRLTWNLLPQQRAVGWIAGVGAALFPVHAYLVTHIQVAVWAALLLCWLLVAATSRSCQAHVSGAMLVGLLAGLLLLVEPIMALAMPFVGLGYWQGACRGGSAWSRFVLARVTLVAVTAALVIGPWLVRNASVHGEFVFVKASFGYAFWQGNNAASWGTDKVPKPSSEDIRRDHDGTAAGIDHALWEARHETLYIDDVLLKPHGYGEFQGLTEPQRSRLLHERATTFIRANPARYAQLCLARLRYFWLFDETNPKTAAWPYRVSTLVWLVLAAAGLWCSRSHWRTLWPSCAIVACVALFHTLTIVSARFRLPLEPLTFVWCAAAVWCFGHRTWRLPAAEQIDLGDDARIDDVSTPRPPYSKTCAAKPRKPVEVSLS